MKNYFFKTIDKVILNILFTTFTIVSAAYIPLLEKELIDSLQNNILTRNLVLIIIFKFLVAIIIYCVCNYLCTLTFFQVITKFEFQLKSDFFKSLMKLNSIEFNKKSIGHYISSFSNDVVQLEDDYINAIVSCISYILSIIINLFVIINYVDWRIGIIIFLSTFLSYFLSKFKSNLLSKIRSDYLNNLGIYTNKIKEIFDLHDLFRIHSVNEICKINDNDLKTNAKLRYKYGKTKSFKISFNGGVSYIMLIATFIIVSYLFLEKQISIGTAVATFGYVDIFYEPISGFINSLMLIDTTKDIQNKFLEILNNENFRFQFDEDIKKITCNQLNYKVNDEFIFNNFDYCFEFGKKYVITGKNGSGKTTLLKIISNSVPVEENMIFYNDQNLTINLQISDLFFVKQTSAILPISFLDNITMFQTNCLDNLKCYSFFESDMYKKLMNCADCSKLSGGEKQFIALCRALCSNAKFILIDEGLSAMDNEIAKRILKELINNKQLTLIYVTHNTQEINMFENIIQL